MKNHEQRGFTLTELMIAILLGLIIVAAGLQLFLTGQRSLNMQKGIADIQSNGVFGLNYIVQDVELSNLDATLSMINDTTPFGGLVLSKTNLPTTITTNIPFSESELNISNVNEHNVALKSDQLVIQFYAVQDGYNCEGQKYSSGRYIIQRYFLRKDDNGASTEPNMPLSLACEAGSYTNSSTQIIPSSFGKGKGQIILHRADYFHILLGTSDITSSGSFRYMNIADYMALSNKANTRVNSIQLGLLVRSAESVGSENAIGNSSFQILDKKITVKNSSNTTAKYLRQVVQQTIALRNGLCVRDSTSSNVTCA